MSTTIENIRGILSDNRPEEALSELQGWLAAGDRNLMKSLVALKRNQGKSRLRGDIRRLIDQLEHESPKLNKFLSHYHAGNEAFDEKEWEEASFHLGQAISLHQPEYLALKQDLQRKLDRVNNHQKLDSLVEAANREYEAKSWTEALDLFINARKHYFPGCPWPMDEFERVIGNCKRAIAFTSHLERGKVAQTEGNWHRALDEFNVAISSYHEDCSPQLSVVEEEVRWTKSQLQAQNRDEKLHRPGVLLARKYALPILFTLTIGALVWLFLEYPSWSVEDDALASASPVEAASSTIIAQEEATEPVSPAEIENFLAEEGPNEVLEEFAVIEQTEDTYEPDRLDELEANLLSTPPVPRPALAGALIAGEEVRLAIRNYLPGYTYRVDYGDGTIDLGKQLQTHRYEKAGTYRLEIAVSNSMGGGNSVAQSITIAAPAISESSSGAPTISSVASADIPREVISEPSLAAETPVMTTPVPEVASSLTTNAAPRDLAEVMPQFPGGSRALKSYLESQTRYPTHARENDVEGKVYVQFVVNSDGSLSNVRLARGIGFGCDEEALRLVNSMPTWIPGSHQGQIVPVRYTLPITFVLK